MFSLTQDIHYKIKCITHVLLFNLSVNDIMFGLGGVWFLPCTEYTYLSDMKSHLHSLRSSFKF